MLQQTGNDGIQDFEILVLLPIGKNDGSQIETVEQTHNAVKIERRDGFIGDHQDLPASDMFG